MNPIVRDILYLVGGILIGLISGFLISKKVTQKQLKENPPINEAMIKALMSGMGRTPTQKQVNQMMKQMNKYM